MVLNEDERVQKRELIKGNRERRHLEQLLSLIKGPPADEAHVKELKFEVCPHIIQGMQLSRNPQLISDRLDHQVLLSKHWSTVEYYSARYGNK